VNSCYRTEGGWIYLSVKAVPGSSKTQAVEIKEGRLKVKIAAAPEDGKANEELRSYLAKLLGLAKRDVTLTAGEKSRLKTVSLPILAEQKLQALILNPKGK
jgi:uncharacterized protein (TIGR00251 family)